MRFPETACNDTINKTEPKSFNNLGENRYGIRTKPTLIPINKTEPKTIANEEPFGRSAVESLGRRARVAQLVTRFKARSERSSGVVPCQV